MTRVAQPRRLGELELRDPRAAEAALGHQLARALDAGLALGPPRLDARAGARRPPGRSTGPACARRARPPPRLPASARGTPGSCPGTRPARPRARSRRSGPPGSSRKYRSWVTSSSAPGERVERVLEPLHRVRVEVVGGLVEQQQIRPGEQRAGDGHPLAHPAGELGHRPVPVLHPEPVEQGARLVLGVPAAERLDAVGERGELRRGPVERLVRSEPELMRRARGARRAPPGAAPGPPRAPRRRSRPPGTPAPGAGTSPARPGGAGARRRPAAAPPARMRISVDLPEPLTPTRPDALVLLDHEGQVVEERAAPEGERDVGGAEEGHRALRLSQPRGAGASRGDRRCPVRRGASAASARLRPAERRSAGAAPARARRCAG